jgi:hypothetical protein
MRILLITPFYPVSGGQQRTEFLCKALRELGRVDVLVVAPRKIVVRDEDMSNEHMMQVVHPEANRLTRKYFISRSLTEKVERITNLGSYDLICGRYLSPISIIALPKDVPTIVDLDDYGFSYAELAGSTLDFSKLRAAAKTWLRHRLERRAIQRFRRFWFVTDQDAIRLAHLQGGVLRNIPRFPDRPPDFHSTGAALLFVGSLWYPPNNSE